ncbi:MAG: diacylglycerol kinase [Spirochaetales bacterium]|nr:MAG: diacylglycerol kinase [Spirochaetales bacterium]
MDPSVFISGIRHLIEKTPIASDEPLEVALVLNPKAGGFSHATRLSTAISDLGSVLAAAEAMPARKPAPSWRVRQTEAPRHAARIAEEFLDEAAMRQRRTWLVILACGDGTSHEFLDALSRAPDELRERFIVLRLPMGTGNDGSDGRVLVDALSRLTGHGRIATQVALRVIPSPGGPASVIAPDGEWRSFNIASIGLDAYVTQQTNRFKSSLPGDFYKLWLDIASVLYDRIYPPRDMEIVALDNSGAEATRLNGKFLLIAIGISGRRTYGGNNPILPDDDNVCAIRQMPLLRKLALKGPVASGRHREFPEALLFSANTLEIMYDADILVQMDGEAHPLVAADFPLRIERTAPLIRHLAHLD